MRGNHDHAQFNLLLGRELFAVRLVVILDLGRSGHDIAFHILAAHGLHDHALGLHAFELPERVVLRFQRLDKGVPVAAEIRVDNFVHPLVDEMIGNLVILLLERLNNQLAVDQIFEGEFPCFLDFFDQLGAGELRAENFLPRDNERTHLRVGDDLPIDDGSDAIDHLRVLAVGGKTER